MPQCYQFAQKLFNKTTKKKSKVDLALEKISADKTSQTYHDPYESYQDDSNAKQNIKIIKKIIK